MMLPRMDVTQEKWLTYNIGRVMGFSGILLLCIQLIIISWVSISFSIYMTTGVLSTLSKPQTISASNAVLSAEESLFCFQYMQINNRKFGPGWLKSNATDEELLCAAHRSALKPLPPGNPRIAFLFLVRGEIPFEPLWQRFFKGHEEKYSLYVHVSNEGFEYPKTSLFYGRTVPSKPVERWGMTIPDAVRRLLAHALLDSDVPNMWFTVVCETTIPVRNFPFVYHYLTNSQLSFVEAFYAWEWFRAGWKQEPYPLQVDQMRKGEVWITVHRRHAGVIVGDFFLYPQFKSQWVTGGLPSEVYIPTLLSLTDAQGLANRTLMYVDWSKPHDDHPHLFNRTAISSGLLQKIQMQRENTDGMYYDSRQPGIYDFERSCMYNSKPNSTCFLFARKFSAEPEDLIALQTALPVDVLDSS